jgi:hypothetical protein
MESNYTFHDFLSANFAVPLPGEPGITPSDKPDYYKIKTLIQANFSRTSTFPRTLEIYWPVDQTKQKSGTAPPVRIRNRTSLIGNGL